MWCDEKCKKLREISTCFGWFKLPNARSSQTSWFVEWNAGRSWWNFHRFAGNRWELCRSCKEQ